MDFIQRLNNFAVSGCIPDITFLLDLTAEESMRRSRNREETLFVVDRIESEKIDFHRHVRDGFLKIASEQPERMKIIDAVETIEQIHNRIVAILTPMIADSHCRGK